MRSGLLSSTVGALVLALGAISGQAAADNGPGISALMPLLAPEPGNKACFVRTYDAAHLRAHPRQRITAMKFLLGVEAYDPKPPNAKEPGDLYYYTFSMSVSRRGDRRLLRTSGDCMGGDGISCVVDCDGGSVALDKMPPANTLIVRLNDDGIRMFHDCDDEQGVLVKAGADDKEFHLERAANDACRALEEQEK
jgi:hypothetical protein